MISAAQGEVRSKIIRAAQEETGDFPESHRAKETPGGWFRVALKRRYQGW